MKIGRELRISNFNHLNVEEKNLSSETLMSTLVLINLGIKPGSEPPSLHILGYLFQKEKNIKYNFVT